MPSVIDDPDHWRQRAVEAFALAEQMADADAKRAMVKIAEEYERLAERAEERIAERLAHAR